MLIWKIVGVSNVSVLYVGQGLCLVNFFTGHVGSWTRVYSWTHVQI